MKAVGVQAAVAKPAIERVSVKEEDPMICDGGVDFPCILVTIRERDADSAEKSRRMSAMSEVDEKRILLVHPLGYSAENAQRDIARLANLMPPLGLASIAAFIEQQGLRTDIVDCFARPDSDERIRAYIREKRPAFIGLTCTTSGFPDAIRIISMAKAVRPEIRSVLGGPHISALRAAILEQEPVVDFSVVGEGERPLVALMEREGRDLNEVPGICYRDKDEVIFTGLQGQGIDLDELPFPAYDKLDGYPHLYRLPIFSYPRAPNASCVSSRGCPYACTYCDRSVFRRSFRFNSAEYVYEHMKYLNERFMVRHISFYDDLFTLNRKRVSQLCSMLMNRPLGTTFNCAAHGGHVDRDLLEEMAAAGCWMISLGIETGDADLLARHRQNADLDLLAETIRAIKQVGIHTKGLLMMGLPGETEQTIRNSMKYVFSLPIDDFNLAKFTPFPGSPIYEGIHQLGTFDEELAKMDCMHFVFVPTGMTREQLEGLFTEFYRRHFTRPKVWWRYFTMFWRSPNSWLRFLENLGSFLTFARSSDRIRRS
jgi:radical SAM superfamily enzyme YgiQ (UPF0313 family)